MEIRETITIDSIGRKTTKHRYVPHCQFCNKEYLRIKAVVAQSRFCSIACKANATRKAANRCIECNSITGDPRSQKCGRCMRVPQRPCINCGKMFSPYHNKQAGKFCNVRCKNSYFAGVNNPNYKGAGIVKYGYDWVLVRNQALERDGYRCQVCGDDTTKLHVHHVVPYRICRSHEIDNLITLCRVCHKTYEFGVRLKERANNYDEFLSMVYADRRAA